MDAIALGGVHETSDDIVRVVAIAHEVLTSQQHLQRSLGTVLLDGAETLPRILVQESQGGIERRPAPDFERPVSYAVHLAENRQHIADLHARGPQRLVSVAKCRISNVYRSHLGDPPFWRYDRAETAHPLHVFWSGKYIRGIGLCERRSAPCVPRRSVPVRTP
jgi:hypothetical protein